MAWKIYIELAPALWMPVAGSWKTEEDARHYYRRNMAAYRNPDGSYQRAIYINQGKGSKFRKP